MCTHPALWKSLYLEEGWSVAEDIMTDFEERLRRMQARCDSYYKRYRQWFDEPASTETIITHHGHPLELDTLYTQFFSSLSKANDFSLKRIRAHFLAIAVIELGEPYHRTATFTQTNTEPPQLHINWRYLYVNRYFLENNWRHGHYQTTEIECTPHPSDRVGIYCIHVDGNLLAAACRDTTIRLWNMNDLSYCGTLTSHEASVTCLQLNSKRGILVSGSADCTIKIWNIHSQQVIITLRDHTESVLDIYLSDKFIMSCSRDTTARIWGTNGETSETSLDQDTSPQIVVLHTLRGHRAAVNAIHCNEEYIATASGDRTVVIWNIYGAMLWTISGPTMGLATVKISNGMVITGGADHTIKIFNIYSGEELHTLRGHTSLVRTIQIRDGKIISGSYDQSIRIWDMMTGEVLQMFRGHEAKYFLLCVTEFRICRVYVDQKQIISCGTNSRIVIWDFTKCSQNGGTVDTIFFYRKAL